MFETSAITISKEAYRHNLAFIKKQCVADVKFCSVVKGNAYGHGIKEFVTLAKAEGVDYFAVYSSDEALEIRNIFTDEVNVMIMGMTDESSLRWAMQNKVEFFVFDFYRLNQALKLSKQIGIKAEIHIEVETGMNRTGFQINELAQVFQILKENIEHFLLIGFCTHYAGAESMVNDFRVRQQINLFEEAKQILNQSGLKPKYIHSACSAGMMNYPQTIGNLVRIGVMQYGFWPNEETLVRFNGNSRDADETLKRLMSWKSSVMTVKEVAKGEYIGYNTSYQAYADMKIAVIPVGYAYGYSRSLSNSGKVLIHGQEAPICGIVNMNALCADVSHIENVNSGDEVVLIGNQGENFISVASFGEMSDQLNYELLTRLPLNIPRRII
ncbi:MAG: alanine racemase [Pelobium sp.]